MPIQLSPVRGLETSHVSNSIDAAATLLLLTPFLYFTVFYLGHKLNSLIFVNYFLEIGATECPALTHPDNGNVLVSDAFAKFHCFKGYVLRGIGRLVCSDDGIWRGTPPMCLSKI